jgi:hypothetical protein
MTFMAVSLLGARETETANRSPARAQFGRRRGARRATPFTANDQAAARFRQINPALQRKN